MLINELHLADIDNNAAFCRCIRDPEIPEYRQ